MAIYFLQYITFSMLVMLSETKNVETEIKPLNPPNKEHPVEPQQRIIKIPEDDQLAAASRRQMASLYNIKSSPITTDSLQANSHPKKYKMYLRIKETKTIPILDYLGLTKLFSYIGDDDEDEDGKEIKTVGKIEVPYNSNLDKTQYQQIIESLQKSQQTDVKTTIHSNSFNLKDNKLPDFTSNNLLTNYQTIDSYKPINNLGFQSSQDLVGTKGIDLQNYKLSDIFQYYPQLQNAYNLENSLKQYQPIGGANYHSTASNKHNLRVYQPNDGGYKYHVGFQSDYSTLSQNPNLLPYQSKGTDFNYNSGFKPIVSNFNNNNYKRAYGSYANEQHSTYNNYKETSSNDVNTSKHPEVNLVQPAFILQKSPVTTEAPIHQPPVYTTEAGLQSYLTETEVNHHQAPIYTTETGLQTYLTESNDFKSAVHQPFDQEIQKFQKIGHLVLGEQLLFVDPNGNIAKSIKTDDLLPKEDTPQSQ